MLTHHIHVDQVPSIYTLILRSIEYCVHLIILFLTISCHNVLKTVRMDFKHTARVHLRSVDKTRHDSL